MSAKQQDVFHVVPVGRMCAVAVSLQYSYCVSAHAHVLRSRTVTMSRVLQSTPLNSYVLKEDTCAMLIEERNV